MIKKKFPNGLTVIYEHRKTDSVAIEINVKTGSINETNEISGISHFIEHLVFKNTKKRTNHQITSAIEDLGGELNAFTDDERTAFHVKILKKHFPLAIDILSDIVLNPLFLEKDIESERKVILREIDMKDDNPLRKQLDLLPNKLFKNHPLGNVTLGDKTTVKNITREQILDYHSTRYTPNNISVAIVGNIKNPFAEVKKFMGNSKPRKIVPYPVSLEEEEITKPIVYSEKKKVENSYLSIGFRAPSRNSKESYAIDIISTILGEGMSSRLFQEVREKKGLVYVIASFSKFIADMGYFMIYSGVEKNKITEAKEIILKEIQKVENISEKELKAAKEKIEGKYLLDIEDNEHLATSINYWETTTGKPEIVHKYPQIINKITTNDIRSAIKNYFKPSSYCQIVIEEE